MFKKTAIVAAMQQWQTLPRQLFSRHSFYILAMAGATSLGLLKLAFFAHWLNIDTFGKLSFALVLTGPASYILGLGLEPFFLRDGSLMAGRGKNDQLVRLRNEAVTLSLIINIILMGIWIFLAWGTFQADAAWAAEIALAASLMLTFNVTNTYFRITARLNLFVSYLLLRQILALGLGFLWIYLGWSVLLAEAISYGLVIAVSLKYDHMVWNWPCFALIKRCLKVGMPMSLGALVLNASVSGDRWLLPHFVSSYEYGLYSFGMIAFTAGCGILNFITPAIIPKWLRSYGENQDRNLLFREMLYFTWGALGIGSLAAAIILICLYLSFDFFLLKYRPAFPYICIIAFGTVLHMANIWGSFLLTLERSSETLVGHIAIFLVQASFYAFGFYWPLNLMHFSLIFLCGRLLSLVLFASRAYYLTKAEHLNLSPLNYRP